MQLQKIQKGLCREGPETNLLCSLVFVLHVRGRVFSVGEVCGRQIGRTVSPPGFPLPFPTASPGDVTSSRGRGGFVELVF